MKRAPTRPPRDLNEKEGHRNTKGGFCAGHQRNRQTWKGHRQGPPPHTNQCQVQRAGSSLDTNDSRVSTGAWQCALSCPAARDELSRILLVVFLPDRLDRRERIRQVHEITRGA